MRFRTTAERGQSEVQDRAGYHCPLCHSPLSRPAYARVQKLWVTRGDELVSERKKLDEQRQRIEERAEQRALKRAAEDARRREKGFLEQIESLRKEVRRIDKERQLTENRRRREEDAWRREVDTLRAKVNARDQPHFGPEGEEDLVAALRNHFRTDDVERHGRNGDVLLVVKDNGRVVGKIVFECKKTLKFQREFTRQLKKAMESHGTSYGLLVSRALPAKASGICSSQGVLVVEPHLAVHVTMLLKQTIIALARAKLSDEGKAAKVGELFEYLRSEEFKVAFVRISDKIRELREYLTREKSSHDGWWRAREQHYAGILREASGVDARVGEILGATPPPRNMKSASLVRAAS